MSEEALEDIIPILRIFIRSGKLEAMTDAGFRLVAVDFSQKLFEKYASAEQKELLRKELQDDADTAAVLERTRIN